MRPEAVIFDLYWTLLYQEETGLLAQALELVEKAGVKPEAWRRAWHSTLEVSWRNEVSLWGRARMALERAGAAQCDGALAEKLAGLMAARSVPRLYDDVRQSLARVKEMGFKMGLVSNISSYRAGWLKELELAPFFDTTALSCELGVTKPDPAIYLAALEGLRVQPGECVFVDDVPPYVQAARDLGMATVRINRFGSEDIYWKYYDDLSFEADLEITRLEELVTWLGGKGDD